MNTDNNNRFSPAAELLDAAKPYKHWCIPTLLYIVGMLIILLWAVILSPCLCVSREHARRMLCQSQLKIIYITCELYAQEHSNAFPATIDNGSLRHKVHYYGKDQKRIMPRFILLEDAEYCHAGDMRHRIWSDGKIEYFYPWKK